MSAHHAVTVYQGEDSLWWWRRVRSADIVGGSTEGNSYRHAVKMARREATAHQCALWVQDRDGSHHQLPLDDDTTGHAMHDTTDAVADIDTVLEDNEIDQSAAPGDEATTQTPAKGDRTTDMPSDKHQETQ